MNQMSQTFDRLYTIMLRKLLFFHPRMSEKVRYSF